MKYTIKSLPNNTYEVEVTIDKSRIKTVTDQVVDEAIKDIKVEGFRPGKAPRNLAEKELNQEKVYGEVLERILTPELSEILKKEERRPITRPRVQLKEAKPESDWVATIQIAEKPTVKLPDYRAKIAELKKDLKKDAIWTPDKETTEKPDEQQQKTRTKLMNDILQMLVSESELDLSDLIIEDEYNQRLTQLLEEIRKLGLTLDSYLASREMTAEQLQESVKKEVSDLYKIEFILDALSEKEQIQVEPKELEALFGSISDAQAKKQAQDNAYMYAAMLRKQKLLDFLIDL
ncbi:MAG: Trigger factor [Microgenomates bacterium OLB22]|nr:MAG: Trigger factor [Microgenomates bacterium OLB22]